MAYITGSVTDANPGPALYAVMAPALTTAGLTLVDTVVISTRTHKVWKSAAASNTQNLDWYLDIGYTTAGAGNISLNTFEFYDPATHLGYRGPFTASGTTIDPTTGSRLGATGSALETNWSWSTTSLTTTVFGYWISATADRVILLCSSAPTVVTYAGLYQPDPIYAAKAAAAMYPLVAGQLGGVASSGTLGLTRIAPIASMAAGGNWNTHAYAWPPAATGLPQLPTGVTTAYPLTAAPIAISSNGASMFARWGWFRDSYSIPSVGVLRGDTCTIGGASYVLGATTGLYSFAFKAA